MARILDANAHFAGQEPKFSIEITKIQLITALNWYNQNKAAKDAEKYTTDFFKKKYNLMLVILQKLYQYFWMDLSHRFKRWHSKHKRTNLV